MTQLLTIAEAADRLQVSVRTIEREAGGGMSNTRRQARGQGQA